MKLLLSIILSTLTPDADLVTNWEVLCANRHCRDVVISVTFKEPRYPPNKPEVHCAECVNYYEWKLDDLRSDVLDLQHTIERLTTPQGVGRLDH